MEPERVDTHRYCGTCRNRGMQAMRMNAGLVAFEARHVFRFRYPQALHSSLRRRPLEPEALSRTSKAGYARLGSGPKGVLALTRELLLCLGVLIESRHCWV